MPDQTELVTEPSAGVRQVDRRTERLRGQPVNSRAQQQPAQRAPGREPCRSVVERCPEQEQRVALDMRWRVLAAGMPVRRVTGEVAQRHVTDDVGRPLRRGGERKTLRLRLERGPPAQLL